MSELNKPEEKPSEAESTSNLSEEQLEQVAGGGTKTKEPPLEYLKYTQKDILISEF
jgi:hypothetical protein